MTGCVDCDRLLRRASRAGLVGLSRFNPGLYEELINAKGCLFALSRRRCIPTPDMVHLLLLEKRKQAIGTNLPPLSLSIVILEQALVIRNSVLAEDKTVSTL